MQEIEVLLVARCIYDQNNTLSVPIHCHTFYHFICVTSGQGEVLVQGNRYLACENMVFIVRPDEMHAITSSEDIPLNTLEVKYNALDDFAKTIGADDTVVTILQNSRHIISRLERIIDEAVWKKWLHEEMISIYFYEVLLHVARQHKSISVASGAFEFEVQVSIPSEARILEKAISYINQNFCRKITLSELSEITRFNEVYFCRVFKKVFGTSPIQYINSLRLHKAKELLIYSTLNVTEISESTGFQSIHYFSRYFTEKEGMSPLEFRQSIKKNVYIYFDSNLSPDKTNVSREYKSNDNIYFLG